MGGQGVRGMEGRRNRKGRGEGRKKGKVKWDGEEVRRVGAR